MCMSVCDLDSRESFHVSCNCSPSRN
jgi:hypothetical protein